MMQPGDLYNSTAIYSTHELPFFQIKPFSKGQDLPPQLDRINHPPYLDLFLPSSLVHLPFHHEYLNVIRTLQLR